MIDLLGAWLIFTMLVFGSATVQAEDHADCGMQTLLITRAVNDLPGAIKTALVAKYPGWGEISDSNGNFNSTDVGDGPRRRFVVADLFEKCAYVAIEHGGRGYFIEIWSFHQADGQWLEDIGDTTHALLVLADAYPSGVAGAHIRSMAIDWYRRDAEKGSVDSATKMGYFNEAGDGVPQDFTMAAKWYRMAALQGDPVAQYRLGILYARGDGVPQDDAQAELNWKASAAQEFRPAINILTTWNALEVEQCPAFSQRDGTAIADLFPLKAGAWTVERISPTLTLKPKVVQPNTCESAVKVCIRQSQILKPTAYWPEDLLFERAVESSYHTVVNSPMMFEGQSEGHGAVVSKTRRKYSEDNFEMKTTTRLGDGFASLFLRLPVRYLDNERFILRYEGSCEE